MECLRFLHDEIGLAHLDIKMENIIITDDYRLAFIDFGHSNAKNSVGTNVVGTKQYMAPEIRMALKRPSLVNYHPEKADIFSLAVVFFILNFECFPFGKAE